LLWRRAIVLSLASTACGFTFFKSPSLIQRRQTTSIISTTTTTTTNILEPQQRTDDILVLFAKKKKKVNQAQVAALQALDALDEEEEEGEESLASKKKKKKKKGGQAANAAAAAAAALDALDLEDDEPRLTKKQMKQAAKQQAVASIDPSLFGDDDDDDQPKLSRKELMRAAKKKGGVIGDSTIKEAVSAAAAVPEPEISLDDELDLLMGGGKKKKKKKEKAGKKNKKKKGKNAVEDDDDDQPVAEVAEPPKIEIPTQAAPKPKEKLTLEEKIRKERPPPRIRVMESAQPNFSSLRMENVGVVFRDTQILTDVSWGVQTGDRIGLVGQNGAGKTTQLRILAGELEPTTGDVLKSKADLRVAMLRQEFIDELVLERTLTEEFMSVFEEETQILKDLREAEKKLENMSADDVDEMQVLLDEMQDLQNKADAKDVYALDSQCRKVMDLMGFTEDEGDDLVRMFSGGWKMRIGLGKVLLREPNILLLDEPTNHLDLNSVEWLEAFLKNQNIPMIIVSHDREFLDQVCTKIVDAEGGMCTEYDGNYSRFLQLKKSRIDAWQKAYNDQEKRIKEERQWINKFKMKQPQAVKQRQAKLEKMLSSDDYIKRPPITGKPFRFRFPDAPRLSPEVAEISQLSHSYSNAETTNHLFDGAELFIEKGDRIAVLGPNGSGKSTLLRLVIGKEKPDEGEATILGQNVVMNYFEQNQADALDLTKTVLETVQGASNGQSYNELRALLGQFLFKGDSVEKKVVNLSGGEKARLSLCCMMLRPANLLILDEPTNHLDIPAKEMLEEALQHFEGSVILISHDRFFVSRVARSIVAIEDKKLVKYGGDYKFYMEQSNNLKEQVEARYVNGVKRIESAPVIDLVDEKVANKKKRFGGASTSHMVTRKNKGVKNAKRMEKK